MTGWNRVHCPGVLTRAIEECEALRAERMDPEEFEAELQVWLALYDDPAPHCHCGNPMRRFEAMNGRCEACRLAEIASMDLAKKPSESVMERIGAPPRYRSYTLLNWRPDWQKIPEKLVKWAKSGKEPFVVLAGANGTGKTHLGLVLLAEASHARRTCAFSVARALGPELMDDAKVEGHPLMARLSRVDTLMLDDLKAEPQAEWAQDKVVALLDSRYLAGKRTIITTNVSMEDLLAIDPRLGSRLHEGLDHETRGPDRRIVSFDEYRKRMFEPDNGGAG